MEYLGGGSGRNMSFTDLVLRRFGDVSDPSALSKLIMAPIEVKGTWQTKLPANRDLTDALSDGKLRAGILPALQQVRPRP